MLRISVERLNEFYDNSKTILEKNLWGIFDDILGKYLNIKNLKKFFFEISP